MDSTNAILTFVLGGGLATTVGAAAKGAKALIDGTHAHEREAIDDLARWRDEATTARRTAEQDATYWQMIASRYRQQIRMAGLTPDPEEPHAPSWDNDSQESR